MVTEEQDRESVRIFCSNARHKVKVGLSISTLASWILSDEWDNPSWLGSRLDYIRGSRNGALVGMADTSGSECHGEIITCTE